MEKISRKDFSQRRILRDCMPNTKVKKQSDHCSDAMRSAEMSDPVSKEASNNMSVIPCRLIDDLHEWRNEVPTVPT